MYYRIVGAVALSLIGARGISAEDSFTTLSELVNQADRIIGGEVNGYIPNQRSQRRGQYHFLVQPQHHQSW